MSVIVSCQITLVAFYAVKHTLSWVQVDAYNGACGCGLRDFLPVSHKWTVMDRPRPRLFTVQELLVGEPSPCTELFAKRSKPLLSVHLSFCRFLFL